jgi:hypothetical protein
MNFNKLYNNLLLEYSAETSHIYSDNELSMYGLHTLDDDKKLAHAAYNFLKKSQWGLKGCRVVVRPVPLLQKIPKGARISTATVEPFRPLYYVLYPGKFDHDDFKMFAKELSQALTPYHYEPIEFSTTIRYPAHMNIKDMGGITDYDPVDEYNVDKDVKDTWRKALDKL